VTALSVFSADHHARVAVAERLLAEGIIAAQRQQPHLARDCFRDSIRARPTADAYFCLAQVLNELHAQYDACDAYARALGLLPNPGGASWFCLASELAALGRMPEAVTHFRRALALEERPEWRSKLVMGLGQYHPGFDDAAVLAEAREFDRIHAAPLAAQIRPHTNDRSPERRLRVGYVSPNFFRHVQALFLFPVLRNHDHQQFEIFCYSDVGQADDHTAELERSADTWRNIGGMNDAAVADLIRRDRIDVLVDLTMHMPDNRLLVFARKPAPVQVTWLAYPGTTGLSAIDYRLTDPYLDPPGSDLSVYAERSLYLESFWPWAPCSTQPVGPLPAVTAGRITFGCLNGFAKVSEEVIALWSRVLVAVPGSRFLMIAPPGQLRTRTLAAFQRGGVYSTRVDFVDLQPRDAYLATFHRIDVFLDTFPCPAHTTALDSAWMGCPVITLPGKSIVSRGGVSIANSLGLAELVARTPDDYVAIATRLASDLPRLAELRAGLRARLEGSPLMNAPRFVRNLEAAYRTAWREWCHATA
jgi:predicted O-linked N-acetylglucosamine transferase (SPINDLY family)